MLKHDHPLSYEEFMERIFWREGTFATPAIEIYNKIRRGTFHSDVKTRKEIMEELGLSHSQYYHILSTLRAVGLIVKYGSEYKSSNEFEYRLKRLMEFVEKWK